MVGILSVRRPERKRNKVFHLPPGGLVRRYRLMSYPFGDPNIICGVIAVDTRLIMIGWYHIISVRIPERERERSRYAAELLLTPDCWVGIISFRFGYPKERVVDMRWNYCRRPTELSVGWSGIPPVRLESEGGEAVGLEWIGPGRG